ncbi:MAG: hypothetical protein K9N48_01700 [Verrucomicrobia bacterium]|nr:hypothetical protein [Verrucomicrobiota bacterium]MCF7707589.1 hypothetical protein [Verrucomicrobiota bacterium]
MKINRFVKYMFILLLTGVVILAAGTGFWYYKFKRYTPVNAVKDIKAAIAAREASEPVERFLESRYGSLSDPKNRRDAFLDFFNVDHIKGLRMISKHIPNSKRQKYVNAMAEWIAEYRTTMSSEEKAALRNRLNEPDSRIIFQQAASRYLQQDIRYRAATAPVITELMITLNEVQNP